MSKLNFQEQPLNNVVVQSLNNTLEYMNKASQKTYSMNVPSGFSKLNEMQNCKNNIIQVTKDLQELKVWINESCKKIDQAIISMNNEALLLPQSQLQMRNEVVR